jgi:deoxyribonucleoside regulator
MVAKYKPLERFELLAEVAELYYFQGMTQQQIADRLSLSRSMISYILQEARRLEVVKVWINQPICRNEKLEKEFLEQFDLREIHILVRNNKSDDKILELIGISASRILLEILQDDMVLGFSAGISVSNVVKALRPRRLPNVRVVQMTGGLGARNQKVDAAEQCSIVAEIFGANHYYINAPLVLDNPLAASVIRQDHSIKDILQLAAKTDVAVVGIGSIEPQASTQFHAGYLSHQELREMEKLGVVGAICVSCFDINGNPVYVPKVDSRVIGVTWDDLSRINSVICIASGKRKDRAILGLLRSCLANILIIDDMLAMEVLRLAREYPRKTSTNGLIEIP